MAVNEGKKSFVIYCDWITFLEELTDEQKGKWLSWTMNYVNDNDPEYPEDTAVRMACKMTQSVLKNDLSKYRDKVDRITKARELKKISNDNNSNINNEIKNDIKNEINNDINTNIKEDIIGVNDNVNVNVNDNVNVNVNVIKEKDTIVSTKKEKSILKLTPFEEAIKDFESMRTKIKKPLTQRAKTRLLNKLDVLASDEKTKIAILNQSTDHCWQDIYALQEENAVMNQKVEEKKDNDDFDKWFEENISNG